MLGDIQNAQKTDFVDKSWRSLDLPHDWSIEGKFIETEASGGRGGYLPTGIGWYRKTFSLPAGSNGKIVWIDFDGVYMNSEVWINGHHLGKHSYGYTGFYYKLTPFLKKGKNIMAIRVDNSHQPNSRWYTGSGIYRHVWLTIMDPIHIAHWGTFITTPEIDEDFASVHVKTSIENNIPESIQAILRSSVLTEDGTELNSIETKFEIGEDEIIELEQNITVKNPFLWSIETPAMYSLKTEIMIGKKTVDQVTTPFGIRQIDYDVDKGFLLNGKRLKMKGVCLHHDGGSVGAAVPERVWERRLELLKEMGCNAIRTAHNPTAPEFLDLCDRMGFLVMDEIFDEWTHGKVEFGYNKYFEEWSQQDLVSFIHRDRNHPSVVMWSAGNEIGEQSIEGGHQILKPLIETFHREDPSRPVTTGNDHIAADGRTATLPFLEMLDIVGYNYVDRWHERRELYFSLDRHDHPEWKMVGTESVSNGGIRGWYFSWRDTTRINTNYNSRRIRAEQLWKFVAMNNYVIGDFMWTGIDYLGEARWPFKNTSSGVIDMCGFPKDGFYFYQSQWTDEPVLHIFPHWNWNGREGQVIPVLVYTNCDTVELFLNGKSFGPKSYEFPIQGTSGGWNSYERPYLNTTTADLHLSWDIPFEPGTIKAIGRKDGKVVLEKEIKTTVSPKAIRLSVDRASINADSRDVAHIIVEIVDEDGNLVPTASNRINFTVTGAGKLIGVDNGNPMDHDPFKASDRKAFNGLALAIVQASFETGEIVVKATSDGLKSSKLMINTLPVEFIPMIE